MAFTDAQKLAYYKKGAAAYKKSKYSRKGKSYKKSYASSNKKTALYRTGGIVQRPELKFLDQEMEAVSPATAVGVWGNTANPAATFWGLVDQGNSASECIGRRYVIKSIDMQIIFTREAAATPQAVPPEGRGIFWALVLDTQTNGVLSGGNAVYDDSALGAFKRNMSNTDRFRVLKKGICYFPPSTITSDPADNNYPSMQKFVHIRLDNLSLTINRNVGQGVTRSFAKENSLILIHKCSGASAFNAAPNQTKINVVSRIRFSD